MYTAIEPKVIINIYGSFVGGCGAQIGGLLLIPVVALVISIFDYIPFRYVIWSLLGIFLIVYLIGWIIEKQEDKKKKRDN